MQDLEEMIDAMLALAAERGAAFRAFGGVERYRAVRLVMGVLAELYERSGR